MIYEFKPEDLQFYHFLKSLGVFPYFETFFENHASRIQMTFENLLDEMRKEEKNERDTSFIKDMDCEQFICAVKFAFEVIFAKDLVRLSRKYNDIVGSSLSALSLAKKMSEDSYNATYVEQLEHVLCICCNSVLSAFRSAKEL